MDTGLTNGAHAGGGLSASPDIWVRSNATETNPPRVHQNPEFGQPNRVFTYLRNTGGAARRGKVELFTSVATPQLDDPADWRKIGEQAATIPPYGAALANILWTTVPAPGHYCLLALWVPNGSSDALQLPGGIQNAVAHDPHLAWHNVNVVDVNSQASFLANLKVYSPAGENIAIEISREGGRGQYRLILHLPPGTHFTPDPTWEVMKASAEGSDISIPLSDGVVYIGGIRPGPQSSEPMPVRFRLEARGADRE